MSFDELTVANRSKVRNDKGMQRCRLRRSKIACRIGSPKALKTTVGSALITFRFIDYVNLASICARNALQRRVKSACVRLIMLPMASFTTDFAKGYSSGLPLVAEGPVVSI